MRISSLASRPDSLVCPLCEASKLYPSDRDSIRCESCGGHLNGAMLQTLRSISALPDVMGKHACECGHPEMRLLPDGTFHCPACRSEVLTYDTPPVDWRSDDRGDAFWAGWLDGHFGGSGSFVHNPSLARLEDPSARLNYYRGHRGGRNARRTTGGQEDPNAC